MIVLEKLLCYSQIPRGEGTPATGAHTGKHGFVGRPGRGELSEEPLLWFQWEGTGESG